MELLWIGEVGGRSWRKIKPVLGRKTTPWRFGVAEGKQKSCGVDDLWMVRWLRDFQFPSVIRLFRWE